MDPMGTVSSAWRRDNIIHHSLWNLFQIIKILQSFSSFSWSFHHVSFNHPLVPNMFFVFPSAVFIPNDYVGAVETLNLKIPEVKFIINRISLVFPEIPFIINSYSQTIPTDLTHQYYYILSRESHINLDLPASPGDFFSSMATGVVSN